MGTFLPGKKTTNEGFVILPLGSIYAGNAKECDGVGFQLETSGSNSGVA